MTEGLESFGQGALAASPHRYQLRWNEAIPSCPVGRGTHGPVFVVCAIAWLFCYYSGQQGLIMSGITPPVKPVIADGNADPSLLYQLVGSGGVVVGGSADVRMIPAKPSIVLQAVVALGEKIKDGHLILAVAPPWFEIAKMIEKDPSMMYQIADRKWEELIAGWYKAYGFDEVILTPRSGDLGRDVIAIKHGVLSVRIIDQVKAFSPGRLVSANDVRALLGVLGSDRAASKGLVTTTSDFAPMITEDELIAPYLPTRLELVNGSALVTRLADVTKKP